MNLILKNIGIIDHATIEIEGLTVITGSNNSGKSTVGKALYGLINAIENVDFYALIDKKAHISNQILRIFDLYRYDLFFDYIKYNNKKFESYQKDILFELYNNSLIKFPTIKTYSQLISVMDSYRVGMNKLTIDYIDKAMQNTKTNDFLNQIKSNDRNNFKKFKDAIDECLTDISNDLKKGMRLDEYISRRIHRSLAKEFNDQIISINKSEKTGEIKLCTSDTVYFDLKLDNQKIQNDLAFKVSPAKEIFFIDDPYIVDKWNPENEDDEEFYPYYMRTANKDKSILTGLKNHSEKIQSFINSDSQNLYSDIENDGLYQQILDIINKVLPGNFSAEENRYLYENKLDIRNLATGSKAFLILKQLIAKGKLNKSCIFVFDEPEVHLHPEWLNLYAEIIVLLIRELEVNILLTTHSMHFLFALDYYSRKHQILDYTHYYKSEIKENEHTFLDITNNVTQAYAKLSDPFVILDKLYKELKLK